MIDICLISQDALGALRGTINSKRHIGGVQRQTALMAHWLEERGHRVSVITWDEGQTDDLCDDGIRVFKLCRIDGGLPGLRFIWPRMTGLYRAMKRANARIYYHNTGEATTGLAANWCRHNERNFIYSVASDLDCVAALPRLKRPWEKWLYRYGLKQADRIIVQSEHQRQLLKNVFGVNSVRLPMPSEERRFCEQSESRSWESKIVLWVGRNVPEKRLKWLLKLAPLVPEARFRILGPDPRSAGNQAIFSQAKRLSNVEWVGAVPWLEMPQYYLQAAMLCCTSDAEGFPNTFLESWCHGKPIVSTFDPDSIIRDGGLGAVAETVETMAQEISRYLGDRETWAKAGALGRAYFEREHSIEASMPRFEKEFLTVSKSAPADRELMGLKRQKL